MPPPVGRRRCYRCCIAKRSNLLSSSLSRVYSRRCSMRTALFSQVDGELVSISIGSDSGLAKDQTLEVYRLKPLPLYVGQIRLVDVRAKEAVGKFVGKPK